MYFDHTSTGDQFAELLAGRKIVKAQNNALWLDNDYDYEDDLRYEADF